MKLLCHLIIIIIWRWMIGEEMFRHPTNVVILMCVWWIDVFCAGRPTTREDMVDGACVCAIYLESKQPNDIQWMNGILFNTLSSTRTVLIKTKKQIYREWNECHNNGRKKHCPQQQYRCVFVVIACVNVNFREKKKTGKTTRDEKCFKEHLTEQSEFTGSLCTRSRRWRIV